MKSNNMTGRTSMKPKKDWAWLVGVFLCWAVLAVCINSISLEVAQRVLSSQEGSVESIYIDKSVEATKIIKAIQGADKLKISELNKLTTKPNPTGSELGDISKRLDDLNKNNQILPSVVQVAALSNFDTRLARLVKISYRAVFAAYAIFFLYLITGLLLMFLKRKGANWDSEGALQKLSSRKRMGASVVSFIITKKGLFCLWISYAVVALLSIAMPITERSGAHYDLYKHTMAIEVNSAIDKLIESKEVVISTGENINNTIAQETAKIAKNEVALLESVKTENEKITTPSKAKDLSEYAKLAGFVIFYNLFGVFMVFILTKFFIKNSNIDE